MNQDQRPAEPAPSPTLEAAERLCILTWKTTADYYETWRGTGDRLDGASHLALLLGDDNARELLWEASDIAWCRALEAPRMPLHGRAG